MTISNLECSLSDSFETPTDWSTFEFKTDTRAVAGLQLAEIDVLNRANNHSFNFGVVGMDDTTDVLDKAGILHFGMGHTIEESRKAALAKVGGVTYAFLGYNGISDQWDGAEANSPGTNPLIDWLVVEDIKRELAAGHVVIPFFHWGTEYVYDPTEEQRAFAQLAIDNGAAMVAPIGDAREWKKRYRLIRLVDHCDLFLVRTRTRRWFRKHVDVDGAWPASGPFIAMTFHWGCLLYTSPSPRDRTRSRMPSSA